MVKRPTPRIVLPGGLLAALLMAVPLAVRTEPARAQSQGYGVPAPPPPPSGGRRAATGYNCEAPQPGAFGPQPYSCPLPGARPIGVRCYCDQPVALFSGPRPPLVGSVVP